jgi:hypothetical protein
MEMHEELEYRLQKLEKSNSRLRSILLICVIFISGALILGIAEADRFLRIDQVEAISITSREFSITDSKGKRRIFIGMSKDESIASIQLFGADSVKPAMELSTSRDGKNSSIAIADSKGKDKMLIRLDNDSSSYITQFTSNGNIGNAFIVKKDRPYMYSRNLSLTDTIGKVHASFVLDEEQAFHPMISFFDSKNILKTRLFYSEKSVSGLAFFDNTLKNRGLFGMTLQQVPVMVFNDSSGKPIGVYPDMKK